MSGGLVGRIKKLPPGFGGSRRMQIASVFDRVAPTATPSSCRSYGCNPFIQSYLVTESPPFRNASPAVAGYDPPPEYLSPRRRSGLNARRLPPTLVAVRSDGSGHGFHVRHHRSRFRDGSMIDIFGRFATADARYRHKPGEIGRFIHIPIRLRAGGVWRPMLRG